MNEWTEYSPGWVANVQFFKDPGQNRYRSGRLLSSPGSGVFGLGLGGITQLAFLVLLLTDSRAGDLLAFIIM